MGPIWRKWLFSAWGLIDYGRSLSRVATIGAVLIILFGTLFTIFPETVGLSCPPVTLHPADRLSAPTPAQPASSCTVRADWLTPYYFSTVTFTTLGFGDIYAKTLAGEILVIVEVLSGYITLGLLLSVLADKVARRS